MNIETHFYWLDLINRKSKILLNRSASVKLDSMELGDCGHEVENVDSGSNKVTVDESTPFIDAGSAVDDASAGVNPVEIGIDGVGDVVSDVVVAEVVVADGVIVECGGYYMC